MSIRPIDYNGMLQRTQDLGGIKHNENQKPVVEQQTIQVEQVKRERELTQKVIQTEEKDNEEFRYDAKEKGNGKYEGKGSRKQKNKKEQKDGEVILKDHPARFDMKI